MTERALGEDAMLASLRDIRLPPDAAGGLAADLAVALGLSALAALLTAVVLRALTQRRIASHPPGLAEALAEARALPEDARRVALLRLLHAHAPQRFADYQNSLYRPDGQLDLSTLEAEVTRLA